MTNLNSQTHRAIEESCRYDLTIAAVFQNEAPYLKEWIEFHKLVGVEHFLLVDNESTDHVPGRLTLISRMGAGRLAGRGASLASPSRKDKASPAAARPCCSPASIRRSWIESSSRNIIVGRERGARCGRCCCSSAE